MNNMGEKTYLYGNAVVQRVRTKYEGKLELSTVYADHEDQQIVLEDLLFTQIDERLEGKRISVIMKIPVEDSIRSLTSEEEDYILEQVESGCLVDLATVLKERGCHAYMLYLENGGEYVSIAYREMIIDEVHNGGIHMDVRKKICFAASSGGHLEEICHLTEIEKSHDSFLVTETSDYNEVQFCDRVIHVNQINRHEALFLLKFIILFIKSFHILMNEKPDYIISTGALATFPLCVVGKLMKIKIIYIESFARVDSPSLTGRLMYRIADLFLVQWEDMLEYYPNATYAGSIF